MNWANQTLTITSDISTKNNLPKQVSAQQQKRE